MGNNTRLAIAISFFFGLIFLLQPVNVYAALLSPEDQGFGGQSRGQNYDELVDSMFANGKVATYVGDRLWVPWFKSSSSCSLNDLQDGNACNAGQIDWEHNCMVTDEFSQVGILVAMGDDQGRMDAFYNTVNSIKSSFGDLPAWRIYRNGDYFEQCKDGINGNCDTASDASARIVIALYTASVNPAFSETVQAKYKAKADVLAADMREYEILNKCIDTEQGEICNWLAAGSQARNGGMASWDFAYTGYYPDAIIAMLMACSQTSDAGYCKIADDLALNYLQAAQWDGSSFTAPPGRSFKWNLQDGDPKPECTGSCQPVVWDDADAPRAIGICQANQYARIMGRELPGLGEYCDQWGDRYMSNPDQASIQFYPDGSAMSSRNGYFEQGLQALFQQGYAPALFEATVDSALSHYSTTTKTFDWAACMGVYHQAFPIRALGTGLGKDEAVFGGSVNPPGTGGDSGGDPGDDSGGTSDTGGSEACSLIESLDPSCTAQGTSCTVNSDVVNGACREVRFSTGKGAIQVLACEKDGGAVEAYLQRSPGGLNFKACLGDGCVGSHSGFARFVPAACTDTAGGDSSSDDGVDQTPDPGSDTGDGSGGEEPSGDAGTSSGIAQLAHTCTTSGGCTGASDATSGTCRTIVDNTRHGQIKVMACEKGGGYVELYRQEYPAGVDFRSCLDIGCIDRWGGFARFKPTGGTVVQAPEPEPAPEDPVQEEPAPVPQPEGDVKISTIGTSCNVDGAECTKRSDITAGTCRTIRWGSPSGDVQILTCEKSPGNAEVYRQEWPSGSRFQACVSSACVNEHGGFASFTY